jgi:dipeptidyl-peptidase-4
MVRSFFISFLLLANTFIVSQQKLTLEDIFYYNKFYEKKIENVQWFPDESAFTYTKINFETGLTDIFKHDVRPGESSLLVNGSFLKYNGLPIMLSSYSFSGDGRFLLFSGLRKKIWRHSWQAPFYILDFKSTEIFPITKNILNLRNVKLSPDGKYVGYVYNSNIYIVELTTRKTRQITNDGNENILNGEFDWIYEEEFGLTDAWRWSPDSKKIAYWKTNQTRVKEFYLVDELGLYNEIATLKYPKAGEETSIIKIGVYNLEKESTVWMDIGTEINIYIPRIFWTNSPDKLTILRLNRRQNHSELLLSNTNTGRSEVIISDSNNTWVEVEHDILFPKEKDEIIWTSEKDGFNHAYLYDYKGNLINQITKGNWEVTSVKAIDEENELLFFYGKKDSLIEQNIYRVKLDGKNLERVSPEKGWHTAVFSPACKYFIDSCSTASSPATTYLRNSDGSLIRKLEDNDDIFNSYNLSFPEFSSFTTTDGVELNYYMIKPDNFMPDKKYPVIVYGYGGPGSQKVVNQWDGTRELWHQYMAQNGYIIFCVDNRGTGGRGKEFKDLAYGDISKWAVHDQIEGAKFLSSLPYVNSQRIGFWGWSGGGYLTLMMMTRGSEYFSTGVSVAPVSNFRLYDAIWTERYMGLPDENEDGYKAANVLTYANQLKGKLLIIHGTGDDNVHFQNTIQIINEFQTKLKQFDLMIYPGRNHGISGRNTKLHLFTLISNYFLNHL